MKRSGQFSLSTPATDCLVDNIVERCGYGPVHQALEWRGTVLCSVLVNLFYK